MKTEKNINGKPKVEHKNLFGVHCDSNNFYFFESNEERILFFEELNALIGEEEQTKEQKTDISNIDIDTLPEDQLLKLANKLKALLG